MHLHIFYPIKDYSDIAVFVSAVISGVKDVRPGGDDLISSS